MTTIFDKSGVYLIENTADGRVYIGSTTQSFTIRWRLHKRQLRQGAHDNRFLQRAWDKYSEIAFAFRVLEVVDNPMDVIAAEQRWIDHYRAQGICYNLAPIAGSNAGTHWSDESRQRASESAKRRVASPEGQALLSRANAKTYPGFVAPDGTVYAPVDNLSAFCAEHGLDLAALHRVHQGKVKRHKGWTRYDGAIAASDQRLSHANAKMYPGFIAPDGTVYRNITNLSEFCRQHGLIQPNMSAVARGVKASHRGWRRLPPED